MSGWVVRCRCNPTSASKDQHGRQDAIRVDDQGNQHRRRHRRREISGILLLAGGLFAGLALASQQVASAPAMGPGGAAIATALYSVWGMAAYLLVAAILRRRRVAFRGRAAVRRRSRGDGRAVAAVRGCGAAATCRSPTANRVHGPGGLLGSRSGELSRPGQRPVGAALAATTMRPSARRWAPRLARARRPWAPRWAAAPPGAAFAAGARAACVWRARRSPRRTTPPRSARDRATERRAHDAHENVHRGHPVGVPRLHR